MRLPDAAHTRRPWRIHEIAPDFRLEDVWGLPAPGGPDSFPQVVQMMASLDPSRSSSAIVGGLFAMRWQLGELLGWGGAETGVGSRVRTLRDRLPAARRGAPGPDVAAVPFPPLYLPAYELPAH